VLAGYAADPARRLGEPPQIALLEREYSAAAIARRQLEIFNRLIAQARVAPPPLSASEYWPDPPSSQP
jgi:hypothetical protein